MNIIFVKIFDSFPYLVCFVPIICPIILTAIKSTHIEIIPIIPLWSISTIICFMFLSFFSIENKTTYVKNSPIVPWYASTPNIVKTPLFNKYLLFFVCMM